MLLIVLELLLLFSGITLIKFRNKISYLGVILCSVFISVPDLYFIPEKSDDLYSYFKEMNIIQPCNTVSLLFNEFRLNPLLQYHRNNYIFNIFEWIIARTYNYSLLPFFSIFIVSLCISLPIVHQYIKHNCTSSQLLLGLIIIFSLFQYLNSSSTVRWALATSILFLVTYISCNTSNPILTLPYYIIPILIHPGTILPITIIIFCIFFKNAHIHWYGYFLIECIILACLYLLDNGNSDNIFLKTFKGYKVIGISATSGWSIFTLFSFFASFIISFMYLYNGIEMININNIIDYNLIKKITILFTLVTITLLSSIIMAQRYVLFIGFGGVLIYLKTIKEKGFISKKVKIIYVITFIIYILLSIYFNMKMSFNFKQINYNGDYVY